MKYETRGKIKTCIKEKQFKQADDILNGIESTYRGDMWLLYKAICLRELGRLGEAEKCFAEIKQKNTKEYYLHYALYLEKIKKISLAIETLKAYPEWATEEISLMAIGRCYQKEKKYHEAHYYFEKIKNWQINAKVLMAQGFCCSEEKNFSKAIEYFEKALRINPENIGKVRENLAICYFEAKKYSQAIPLFKDVLKLEPKNAFILLNLVACYDLMGDKENFTTAYQKLWNLKETNKAFLMQFSKFYQKKQNFSAAKNALESIKNYQADKTVLMELGRIAQLQGKKEEALNYLYKINHWNTDNMVLIEIGRYYQISGNYDNAIETYSKISPPTRESLLRIGICYIQKSDFDKAIQSLQMYPNWEKDKIFLINIAIAYRDKGNIDEALKIFSKLLQNYGNEKNILIPYAVTYEYIKKYDAALSLYLQIENLNLNKALTLMMARCYHNNGETEEAIKLITQLKWYKEKDHVCYLHLAEFKYDAGEYDEAIKIIHSVPKYYENKELLLYLAKCYQKKNMFSQAEICCHQISNWENDKDVLIFISGLYVLQGSRQLALQNYQDLYQRFPESQTIALHYLKFFLENNESFFENNESKVLAELDKALQKWPYMPKLYLLKANYKLKNNNLSEAFRILQETIQKFPYCEDAYVSLLRYYLRNNNQTGIDNTIAVCKQKFSNNEDLFQKIHHIIKGGIFLEKITSINLLKDIQNLQVVFPLEITALFKLLKFPANESCYLVGSVNHHLILNTVLPPAKDIDIITTADAEFLVQKGFKQNIHIPELFTMNVNGRHIDCMSVREDYSTAGQPFISINSKMRAFTVLCLFCDKDGNIYDPTGYGVGDLQQKMLRAIGDPMTCFMEDPIRLLIALRLIAQGFFPTIDVQNAIKNFAMDNDLINKNHLFAVTKKYLAVIDNMQYLRLLNTYGLLPKLYGILPSQDDQTNLQQLFAVINKKDLYIPNQNFENYKEAKHAILFGPGVHSFNQENNQQRIYRKYR